MLPTLAVVGAAAAVIAALALTGVWRGGAVRPDAAAAAVLQRAARAAEASGFPGVLRPGEYWYVKARFTSQGNSPIGNGVNYAYLITYTVELWTARDGSGRTVTHAIRTSFPTARDRHRWEQAGRPVLQRNSSGSHPRATPRWISGMTYAQMIALPTSVDALTRRLEPGGKGSSADALFTTIGDLLREDPIPAPLRAALYRIAAGIPGIHLVRLPHYETGRSALAVTYTRTDDGPILIGELLFDPRTFELLGEWETGGSTSAYLDQGIVKHLGQRP